MALQIGWRQIAPSTAIREIFSRCCVRATMGQMAIVPLRSVTNSHRLMITPNAQKSIVPILEHCEDGNIRPIQCPTGVSQQMQRAPKSLMPASR